MSYCVNPWCDARTNSNDEIKCQACGTPLKINQRYHICQSLLVDHLHPYTEVFEVLDSLTGIPKVLKTLKATDHPKLLQLFEQERDLLFKLTHSGIPKFEEYFEIEITHPQLRQLRGLGMEKIAGENLEVWLQQHQKVVDESQALNWLEQIAIILAYQNNGSKAPSLPDGFFFLASDLINSLRTSELVRFRARSTSKRQP